MSICFLSWRRIAHLLPLLLIAQRAAADDNDTINLNLSTTFQQDSNLFRLSSSADPNAVLGKSTKSDQILLTSLILKLSKQYSLQRFELEASAVDYRFRTFDYLSFTSRNYAAAWRWKLTPDFHGNLTSIRTEMLNSFTDYTGYKTRNLRTDENLRLDGVFELDGAWRILAGIGEVNRKNSLPFSQEGDSRSNTADAGLSYAFSSGSSLTYTARTGHGEYLNRPQPLVASLLDNGFDDRENEVRLNWTLTGKTTLAARAAHLERKHANFAVRDFGGNIGNVNLDWGITDKTRLTASWARELSSYQDYNTSYTSTDHFTLSPLWQISAKTTLRGRFDYAQREYRGAIVPTALNDRVDTLRTGMVALEWQPLRMISLSTALQSDRRASSEPGLDYDAKLANVSAQLNF